jgi:hypothetical protein
MQMSTSVITAEFVSAIRLISICGLHYVWLSLSSSLLLMRQVGEAWDDSLEGGEARGQRLLFGCQVPNIHIARNCLRSHRERFDIPSTISDKALLCLFLHMCSCSYKFVAEKVATNLRSGSILPPFHAN